MNGLMNEILFYRWIARPLKGRAGARAGPPGPPVCGAAGVISIVIATSINIIINNLVLLVLLLVVVAVVVVVVIVSLSLLLLLYISRSNQ